MKNKIFIISFLLSSFCTTITAQQIVCKMPSYIGESVKLEGFKGFKNYTISTASIDKDGVFSLSFSKEDYGMGYITVKGQKPFLVVLSNEQIVINASSFNQPQEVVFEQGNQNQLFSKYASEQPKREQALLAWSYLNNLYTSERILNQSGEQLKFIQTEEKRLQEESNEFIKQLPSDAFIKWFLPVRKTVSNVSSIAQQRVQEIPATIAFFRKLNYSDNRLYKSGLLKDAIEGHFWLIENSGQPLDTIQSEMKKSIDAIIGTLLTDETKLNEITDYLFDLLERQSLFQASEYLALKVLNEKSCTINNDLAKQLETYRAMKKGNIAPDIEFPTATIYPSKDGANQPRKLTALKSKYTLVVFGASWCPKCKEELPEIAKNYTKWKANDVEVVFVSLDDDKKQFENFASSFPFISMCDFKKWNSPIANNYYVFGTPTIYLLDQKREILLRPISVKQMDAWVDWFLIKENK
jgi:thiol-disulfide isomerase/thioredoxin